MDHDQSPLDILLDAGFTSAELEAVGDVLRFAGLAATTDIDPVVKAPLDEAAEWTPEKWGALLRCVALWRAESERNAQD